MLASVSDGLPLCDTRRLISSIVHSNDRSWMVGDSLMGVTVNVGPAATQPTTSSTFDEGRQATGYRLLAYQDFRPNAQSGSKRER